MTEPPFDVALDRDRCFVRVTWRGLWQVATVRDYAAAVTAVGRELVAAGCAPTEIRALVDARALGPQPQDVVAAYKEAFEGREARVGRVATLTGSALFQMQVKRVNMAGHRTFGDEGEALAWLFAPGDAA